MALLRVGGGIASAHTTMRAGEMCRQLAVVDQADDERSRQAEHLGDVLRREVAILRQNVHDPACRQIGEQLLDGSPRHRWQPDAAVSRAQGERLRSRQLRGKPLAVTRTEFEPGAPRHEATVPTNDTNATVVRDGRL